MIKHAAIGLATYAGAYCLLGWTAVIILAVLSLLVAGGITLNCIASFYGRRGEPDSLEAEDERTKKGLKE